MEALKSELLRVIRSITATTWQYLGLGFVSFVLPLILFVQIADEVTEQETKMFDESILRAVNNLSQPWLDIIVVAVTDLGYTWWLGFATLVMLLLLVRAKKYRQSLIVVIGMGGSALINLLLKLIFQRDRPELWERLVTENSYSFPSGHAMGSASLAAVVVVVLWPTKWRYVGIVGAVIYMLVIGFTRLYLGVHYPTDIVAGWLVAVSWVAITTIVIKRLWRRAV